MYLWLMSNPSLSHEILAGRDLRAQAFSSGLRHTGYGFERIVLAGAAAVIRGTRRSFARFADWNRRRQAIRQLSALDSRVLKDIGLHRSEIPSLVSEIQESEGLAGERIRGRAVARWDHASRLRRPHARTAVSVNDNLGRRPNPEIRRAVS